MYSSTPLCNIRDPLTLSSCYKSIRVSKKNPSKALQPLGNQLLPQKRSTFLRFPTRIAASTHSGHESATGDLPQSLQDDSNVTPSASREERVQTLLEEIHELRVSAALNGLGSTPGYNPSTDLRPSMFYTPLEYTAKPSTIQRAGIAYEAAARVEALIQKKRNIILSNDSAEEARTREEELQQCLDSASLKVNRLVDETRAWQVSHSASVEAAVGTRDEVNVLRTAIVQAQDHQNRLAEDLIRQSQLAGELVKLAAQASLNNQTDLRDSSPSNGPISWVSSELGTQLETVSALEAALLHKIEEYDARLQSMEAAEDKLRQAEDLLAVQEGQIHRARLDLGQMHVEVGNLTSQLAASPIRLARLEAEVAGPLAEAEKAMEEMVQATQEQQELLGAQIASLQSEVGQAQRRQEQYNLAIAQEKQYQQTIAQLSHDLDEARAQQSSPQPIPASADSPTQEVLKQQIQELELKLQGAVVGHDMYIAAVQQGEQYLARVGDLEAQLQLAMQMGSNSRVAELEEELDHLKMVEGEYEHQWKRALEREKQYQETISKLKLEVGSTQQGGEEKASVGWVGDQALLLQQMLQTKAQLGRSFSKEEVLAIQEMMDSTPAASLAAKVCSLEQQLQQSHVAQPKEGSGVAGDLAVRVSELERELGKAKLQEGIWSRAVEREQEYQLKIDQLRESLAAAQTQAQSRSGGNPAGVAALESELASLRVSEGMWKGAAEREGEYQRAVAALEQELLEAWEKASQDHQALFQQQVQEAEQKSGAELTVQDILAIEMDLVAKSGANLELESKVAQLEVELGEAREKFSSMEIMSQKMRELERELAESRIQKKTMDDAALSEAKLESAVMELERDIEGARLSQKGATEESTEEKSRRAAEIRSLEAEVSRAKRREGMKEIWGRAAESVYQETIQSLLVQLEQEQAKAITDREAQLLTQVHKTEQRLGREISVKHIADLDAILSNSSSERELKEKVALLESKLKLAELENISAKSSQLDFAQEVPSKPAPVLSFWGEVVEGDWASIFSSKQQ